MHARVFAALFGGALLVAGVALAQDDKAPAKSAATVGTPAAATSTPAAAAGKPAAPDTNPAVAKFHEKLGEWKKMLAEGRQKQFEYKAAKPEEKKKIEDEFNAVLARGAAFQPQLTKAAEEAYLATDGKNDEATAFLATIADQQYRKDNYEESLRLAQLLIEHGYPKKTVYNMAGVSAFNTSDFDTAEKDLKLAAEAKVLDQAVGARDLSLIDEYRKKWQQEQELRSAEAKANDLPQVVLHTTKGDIKIELFENEAPNTVANFVKLIQQGFYNGTPFHRVLPGFMAQGGDPTGSGTGGPGYTIACETDHENHRSHFRGTLSMAHAGKDTGGSQFFLTFAPAPHLDGQHTVFGRVVEGMDVLAKLTRRDPDRPKPADPDTIERAEVLRKRNHVYDPKTQPDKEKQ